MDVKERRPYCSLTKSRRDKERRYTNSSTENEECRVPTQKSYSSSETLKAFDHDSSRLLYGNRVKDLVHRESDEYSRQAMGIISGTMFLTLTFHLDIEALASYIEDNYKVLLNANHLHQLPLPLRTTATISKLPASPTISRPTLILTIFMSAASVPVLSGLPLLPVQLSGEESEDYDTDTSPDYPLLHLSSSSETVEHAEPFLTSEDIKLLADIVQRRKEAVQD
ncbi:hypothetical protein JD844_026998 [Phrynosoma platyrhinos]|uniref:Teneurin N-terminal domain-containing protein n=1 Tax=Phrynosoma platyrhinos TaxID=52577 RepID=A0ABQ7SFL8_PHRPL|nr:hypothetical protein JD844_026998 [Phrynosoma platyrhinos]